MMITKSSNNSSDSKTVAAAAVVTLTINFMHHSPSEAIGPKQDKKFLKFYGT